MLNQKEMLFTTYYELTEKLLNSFVQGTEENVVDLLDAREECIAAINTLDKDAGQTLTNDRLQQLITELIDIEKDIRKYMDSSMKRLANQVRFAQNEQYLSKQYEDPISVSKGIFYDKSK
jgi:hypothetical protein